jgi:hypothetical protein
MTRRRNFLTAGATVLGTLIAGCSDDEQTPTPGQSTAPNQQPRTPPGGRSPIRGQTPPSTATGTPTSTATLSPTPTTQELLVRRTGLIVDQVHWFATRHDATIRDYRQNVNRVRDVITAIIDSRVVREQDIDTLESVTTSFEQFLQSRLWPHFQWLPFMLRNNRRLREVNDLRERNDMQGALDELGRMQRFYRSISRSDFIEWYFSDAPIYGPLYWQLAGDFVREDLNPEDESERDNDFSGNADLVFRINYPDERYHPRIQYRDGFTEDDGRFGAPSTPEPVEFDVEGTRRDALRYRQLFSDFSITEGRVRRLFITVNGDRSSSGDDDEEPDTSDPIFVQEFSDAGAASRAIQSILEAEATTSHGTMDIDELSWQRASGPNRTPGLFEKSGNKLYVNFLQAGPYLITAFPSVEWWDDRGDSSNNDSDPSSQPWTELVLETWLYADREGGGGR